MCAVDASKTNPKNNRSLPPDVYKCFQSSAHPVKMPFVSRHLGRSDQREPVCVSPPPPREEITSGRSDDSIICIAVKTYIAFPAAVESNKSLLISCTLHLSFTRAGPCRANPAWRAGWWGRRRSSPNPSRSWSGHTSAREAESMIGSPVSNELGHEEEKKARGGAPMRRRHSHAASGRTARGARRSCRSPAAGSR